MIPIRDTIPHRHFPFAVWALIAVNAFVFLSPVFGVLIAWAALGESATALQAAGALGVASGIWIVNTGR